MTKKQAATKINSTIKKTANSLVKEIESILKEGDFWYSADDLIKTVENMHKPKDRNGDQLAIDYVVDAITGADKVFVNHLVDSLWTKKDIEA